MLQFIRDKSQGVIAIIIFGVIALSFALWGIHNYFYGNANQAAVATVNGQKITSQQLAMAVQRAQAQARSSGVSINTQAQLDQLKEHVLQGLIYNQLLKTSAQENGFGVSPQLIEMTLAKLPAFQVNGVFSKERFLQLLQAVGYTQQEFFNSMSNSLLLQQVHSGIAGTAFSLPYQVERSLSLINQKRSFAYFTVPASQFASGIELSADQIQQFYQAHQSEFTIPQKVSVGYVKLSLDDLEKNIQPSASDLESFYQNNISTFSVSKAWKVERIQVPLSVDASDNQIKAAQKKVDTIYQQLKKGASFSMLSKENPPQDTLENNGWINLFEAPKSMQMALISLNTVGAMSKPFRTNNGFEIVKVDAIRPSKVHPYNQVATRVKKLYIQQTAQKQYSNEIDKLSNITFEHPNSLQPAADALNLKVQTSPLFSKTDGQGLFANAQVVNAAFSSDVLSNGNNSDLLNINDTNAVVLRVVKNVSAKVKPLSEVTSEIKATLTTQQADLKAKSQALKLLQQVNSIDTLKQAAEKNHYTVKTVSELNRNNPPKDVSSALIHAAFNMPAQTTSGSASNAMVVLPNGEYAVMVLASITNPDTKTFNEEDKASFANANFANQGSLDYALYMFGLKHSAKIQYAKLSPGDSD